MARVVTVGVGFTVWNVFTKGKIRERKKTQNTPLSVAMGNCCPSEGKISRSVQVRAACPSPCELPSTRACTERAAWQVQPELASPFLSKTSCLSTTASCWAVLTWNPGCERQSAFLTRLGQADPRPRGRRASAPRRAGAEQPARHRARSAPGWAGGHVLCAPTCRGARAGLRTCRFSFFFRLAERWRFAPLQPLWFCPGTREPSRFPSALGDRATGLWLHHVCDSHETQI